LILQKFKKGLADDQLVRFGDRILLALSGGADSVCLFHLFLQTQKELNLSFAVAHLHHGIRGRSADRDADFVKLLAKNYEISCYIRKIQIPKIAHKRGLSLEAAGREQRYIFFEKCRREGGYDWIATGHHADDQTETVLMHLLKGSGLDGLRGMIPKQGKIVRPLLGFPKHELLDYLNKRRIPFCTDETNLDNQFLRNRIRHKLVPFLKREFNPRIEESLWRLSQIAREVHGFLQLHINKAVKYFSNNKKYERKFDLKEIINYPQLIFYYILRDACRQILRRDDYFLTYHHFHKFLGLVRQKGPRYQLKLPGRLILEKSREAIKIFAVASSKEKRTGKRFLTPFLKRRIPLPGETKFGGYIFRSVIKDFSKKLCLKREPSREAIFDYDKLEQPLYVRFRYAGDRFWPLGMPQSIKLKDFLINAKIDPTLRDQIPVVTDRKGTLIWVAGVRISQRTKVEKDTKRVALFNLQPIKKTSDF